MAKQFPQVRLDVSLVKQVVGDSLNAACVAAAFVRLGIGWRRLAAVIEVLDGRVALDPESLRNLLILCGVDLRKFNFALHVRSYSVPLGLQRFAVAAPGSVELNKPNVF